MASGVEIRMPFMDHRLVTYTFSLPWTSKVGGTYTKRIMRDALKGILRQRKLELVVIKLDGMHLFMNGLKVHLKVR
jgi:asparagine synthetase B (glutamine-hydrolysing)